MHLLLIFLLYIPLAFLCFVNSMLLLVAWFVVFPIERAIKLLRSSIKKLIEQGKLSEHFERPSKGPGA